MKEKENSDKENRKDEDDVDMDDILVAFFKYRLLPQVKNFTVKLNNFYLENSQSRLSRATNWSGDMK